MAGIKGDIGPIIIADIKKKYKKDYLNKNISGIVISKMYQMAIDKVLEGKMVKFNKLGELKIYKKESVYNHLEKIGAPLVRNKFKKVDSALHGYYYYMIFDNKILNNKHPKFTKTKRVKYVPTRWTSKHIKDIVMKRNLDLPLYQK